MNAEHCPSCNQPVERLYMRWDGKAYSLDPCGHPITESEAMSFVDRFEALAKFQALVCRAPK